MKKQIKAHEERNVKSASDKDPSTPVPSYLLDRSNPTQAKALSSSIKNKRADKAARFSVPLPKVINGRNPRASPWASLMKLFGYSAIAANSGFVGPRHQRGGDVQGGEHGQEEAQELEAHDHEVSHLRNTPLPPLFKS